MTEFYKETTDTKIKRYPCYHIWDKELVDGYRDNNTIRTKKTTTLFHEQKLWKKCANAEDHKGCCEYDQWKAKHKKEHRDLCQESENSSRVVFIPGKITTPIEADGFLKSLDPPCLLFSQSFGKHPFTCENCNSHKDYLQDLMDTPSALLISEKRIGRKGFATKYAKKTEMKEHMGDVQTENENLKKTIKQIKRRTNFEQKSWEHILQPTLFLLILAK